MQTSKKDLASKWLKAIFTLLGIMLWVLLLQIFNYFGWLPMYPRDGLVIAEYAKTLEARIEVLEKEMHIHE